MTVTTEDERAKKELRAPILYEALELFLVGNRAELEPKVRKIKKVPNKQIIEV